MIRKGITLVEVLVAVGIVLIIAGITFPVFSRSKEAAKSTVCINNLSQIGKALAMYAIDYDNRYPPYNTMDVAHIPIGGGIQAIFDHHPAAHFKELLLIYGVADDQFYCPSDPLARSEIITSDYFTLKFVMTYQHSVQVLKFKIVNYSFDDFAAEDPAALRYLEESPAGFRDLPKNNEHGAERIAVFPHGKYQNTLFLDGHVKRVNS